MPIYYYDLLFCLPESAQMYGNVRQTPFEILIDAIFNNYNPSSQSKCAIQILLENDQLSLPHVKNHMKILRNYFSSNAKYGPGYIRFSIGPTYGITDPICTRFGRKSANISETKTRKCWIVQELKNLGLSGFVVITKDESGYIEVCQSHYVTPHLTKWGII